jgi:hypothetical protein
MPIRKCAADHAGLQVVVRNTLAGQQQVAEA